jgi:hypothetical protein
MQGIKKYFKSLLQIIKEKRVLNLILVCLTPLMFTGLDRKIKHYLLILLFLSFALQYLLLIRKSYLLYIVRVLLIVMVCFEFLFGRLNTLNSVEEATPTYNNWYIKDSILGWKFKPNSSDIHSFLITRSDTIYDVTYSSDKYGRRIGSDDRTDLKKDKHAVFFGCSFVFGLGLPYTSTIPYLFENNNSGFKSYNYGFAGYAPHQFALLFSPGVDVINKSTIKETDGFTLYTYVSDHPNRVYGGSSYVSWGSASPDVYVDSNKLLVKKRSPLHIWLAKLYYYSETLKYFNIELYYPGTKQYYKRFADIINYTAFKYWALFPSNGFYVSLYPSEYKDTAWIRYLNKKIRVINVPLPPDYEANKSKYHIDLKYDLHPSKMLNQYYTNYISNSITQK